MLRLILDFGDFEVSFSVAPRVTNICCSHLLLMHAALLTCNRLGASVSLSVRACLQEAMDAAGLSIVDFVDVGIEVREMCQ